MKAFHGDKAVKKKYLDRVKFHIKSDNLIRGQGWDGTKGCAVGCTLERYSHSAYETELGIPEWLAHVEDTLFEGMTETKSRTWPAQFLSAIRIGADLEPVKAKFICVILGHTLKSMDAAKYDKKKWPGVAAAIAQSKAAVKQLIVAQKSGDRQAIESARSAAQAAAE